MIKKSDCYCCYGRGATFVRASGVGTSALERDFHTLRQLTLF